MWIHVLIISEGGFCLMIREWFAAIFRKNDLYCPNCSLGIKSSVTFHSRVESWKHNYSPEWDLIYSFVMLLKSKYCAIVCARQATIDNTWHVQTAEKFQLFHSPVSREFSRSVIRLKNMTRDVHAANVTLQRGRLNNVFIYIYIYSSMHTCDASLFYP